MLGPVYSNDKKINFLPLATGGIAAVGAYLKESQSLTSYLADPDTFIKEGSKNEKYLDRLANMVKKYAETISTLSPAKDKNLKLLPEKAKNSQDIIEKAGRVLNMKSAAIAGAAGIAAGIITVAVHKYINSSQDKNC